LVTARITPPDQKAARSDIAVRDGPLQALGVVGDGFTTVRISLSARSTAGLIGPFVLVSDDGTSAAFLENAETGEVIHEIEMMHKLNQRWELLSGLAHPAYETIKIIQRVMEA
jgi:hypothetical protein